MKLKNFWVFGLGVAVVLFTTYALVSTAEEMPSDSAEKSESLPPPTDINKIITELQYSESLIRSGRGRFHLVAADKITTDAGVFAFDGAKSYFEVHSTLSNKQQMPVLEFVFNGEIFLTISRDEKDRNRFYVVAEYGFGVANETDPRDWGYWYRRIPLSEYLTTHNARLFGTELLELPDMQSPTPCYLIEADDKLSASESVQFWIAPEIGFRCVQSQREVRGSDPKGNLNISVKKLLTRRFYYQKYQLSDDTSAWYLSKGVHTTNDISEGHLISEVVMEISDFEPNADTSAHFELKLKPDQEVFHGNLRKSLRFEELGW